MDVFSSKELRAKIATHDYSAELCLQHAMANIEALEMRLSGVCQDADSWEANAQYMLERCPYTVWQRPSGGPVDLKATLVVTFQGMQMRLEGHPLYERKLTPDPATFAGMAP